MAAAKPQRDWAAEESEEEEEEQPITTKEAEVEWNGEKVSQVVSFSVDPPAKKIEIKSWKEMGLKEDIVETLMNYTPPHLRPFRIHEIAIPLVLENSSEAVMIHAPTGHGKTAAFTVPILQRLVQRKSPPPKGRGGGFSPTALVMTHTRDLARQHQSKIMGYGALVMSEYKNGQEVEDTHKVGLMVGAKDVAKGENKGQKQQRLAIESQACQAYVVVGTLQKVKSMLGAKIQTDGITTVVFDEVDALMENNEQDILDVMRACPKAQPLFVSATIPDSCYKNLKSMCSRQKLKLNCVRTKETARTVLQANFCLNGWERKHDLVPRLNEQVPMIGKRMVFVQRVNKIDNVVQQFKGAGEVDAIGVHSNSHQDDEEVVKHRMSAPQARQRDMKLFETDRSGHNVCVCTDDLARGIDIDTTRAVINYELPRLHEKLPGGRRGQPLDELDVATYKHRMGRATRSEGASGVCINLVGSVLNEPVLLKQLCSCDELKQYGPQYFVPRETVEIGKEIEVKFNRDDGYSDWRFATVQSVNPNGSVNVVIEDDATEIPNVPLSGHESARVPFDYGALNDEISLFTRKATVERSIMACLTTNVFGNLDQEVESAREVIQELRTNQTEENKAWREYSATFLTKLIAEARAMREEQKADAPANEPKAAEEKK